MNKLRFYMTIVACLAVTAAAILRGTLLYEMALQLIAAIAVFYPLGSLLQAYLKKKVFSADKVVSGGLAGKTPVPEDETEGQNSQ